MRDFTMRVDVFDLLGEPKYDVSTSLGAYCWAVFELDLADAVGRAVDGRAWGVEGDGGGVSFGRLKEALVDRARRGDEEAVRALLDAADVRVPEIVVSLGEAVNVVDTSEVRGMALSAEDDELRSRAEVLFAWVDDYKRVPFPDTSSLVSALFNVSYDIVCSLPPPEDLAVPEEIFTIEEIRALTLEEVENLTPEQLRDIDIETVTNDGLLLRDFPLDLQLAWGEKSLIQVADHIRDRCCYNYTVEELVERFARLLEKLSFVGNENDPSTPLGAYCWSIWEVYRSEVLHSYRYFDVAIFDLLVAELRVRVEMGVAGAADALRGVIAEATPTEFPFAEALASVDDPRVRGTAFSAEDPVLLEAVRVFYDLVDEYRQEETPSPYAFMGEFLPYIVPRLATEASLQSRADAQALKALLDECNPPGGVG